MAADRSLSAGRSCLTVGSAARVNGRSSCLITGVVLVRNGRTWRSVGPSARAPGRRCLQRRAERLGEPLDLGQRRSASTSSVEGSWRSVCSRFASWLRERGEDRVRVHDEVGELRVAAGRAASVSSEKLWTTRSMFARRLASASLTSREYFAVGSKRRSVCPSWRPLPFSACAAVGEQQPQVVARVGVERRRGPRRG